MWTGNFSNVDQIELISGKIDVQIDSYSHVTHYKQFIFTGFFSPINADKPHT